jgi:hypothetical protein
MDDSDMETIDLLRKQQELLKEEICNNLDLLIGSVGCSPKMTNYNLTTKVKGKTVTRSVRKELVQTVKIMTDRNKRVRSLLQKLSSVNWEILKLESK